MCWLINGNYPFLNNSELYLMFVLVIAENVIGVDME